MTVQLSQIHLKHFRCFEQYQLELDAPIVLLEGANGIGKTSILEALHYACYLRSFRTHSTKELIAFGKEGFFIKVALHNESKLDHTIQVGFSHNKRLVKVDQQTISSYKDLMSYYKVLSITEDDLALIKGGPQARRLLMDQFLLLTDSSYGNILREYRQVVDQRNALLNSSRLNNDMYAILTQQVWQRSNTIQIARQQLLTSLEARINKLSETYLADKIRITFSYQPKVGLGSSVAEFEHANHGLYLQEKRYKRTLFGVHLDDILISFCGKPSRLYASRGQQKLIVLLIKMAQKELLSLQGDSGIFLLDDFMTDFDPEMAVTLLDALAKQGSQLIFTSPTQGGFLSKQLAQMGAQTSKLTY